MSVTLTVMFISPKECRHRGDVVGLLQIVEFGGHELQLENLAFLFEHSKELSVHYRAGRAGIRPETGFSSQTISVAKFSDVRKGYVGATLHFYRGILSLLPKATHVFVATGPEQSRLSDALFFLLISALARDKIILNIRRPDVWVRGKGPDKKRGLHSWLRRIALRNVERITFESIGSKEFFACNQEASSKRLSHIPTQLSDYLDNRFPLNEKKPSPKFRIGLLGGLDEKRRDYNMLVQALTLLPREILARIVVVLLGRTDGVASGEVLASLRGLVQVEGELGVILSRKDFYIRGSECSVLISPLRAEVGYGSARGTGSFGDAISLRKKLIIPAGVDGFHEHAAISMAYKDTSGLTKILFKVVSESLDPAEGSIELQAFSRRSVLSRLRHELNFDRWSFRHIPDDPTVQSL